MQIADSFLLLDKDDISLQLGSITKEELHREGYTRDDIYRFLSGEIFENKYVMIEDFVTIPKDSILFYKNDNIEYFIDKKGNVYSNDHNKDFIKKLKHVYCNGSPVVNLKGAKKSIKTVYREVFGKEFKK